MSKEMYMAEVERIAAQLVDQGMDEDEAYELASERGYDALIDRVADMADMARLRAKEGR